jgi:hypothetical protein
VPWRISSTDNFPTFNGQTAVCAALFLIISSHLSTLLPTALKQTMIIDQKLSDDPPSYDELIGALPAPPSEKLPLDPIPGQPSSSTSPALTATGLPRLNTSFPSNFPSASHPRPSSSTKSQIQATVQQLLRTLVAHHLTDSDPLAAQGLLDSCVTACTTYDLSLSSLLQLKYIETHSPIYWALIKRPSSPSLAELLFELAKPYGEDAVAELRDGVLVNSDHRFLRMFLAGEGDGEEGVKVLLDDGGDIVDVDGIPGDDSAFCVHLSLSSFQKRMVVKGEVKVEFVAKGRLFRLFFHKSESSPAETGSWLVSLFILGASPSTFIDSRLIIPDPSISYPITPTQASPSHGASTAGPSTSLFDTKYSQKSSNPKPTISIRLRSPSNQPLVALPPDPKTRPQRRRWAEAKKTCGIEVSLEQGSLMGASLTYSGTSYLAQDGKLRGRLEAKLGKPESDCVVC